MQKALRGDSCWFWIGCTKSNGYGLIQVGGKLEHVHRASWMAHRGPIPNGLWVLHHCDVRNCINPEHLYLGTHSDNTADMVNRGRFNPERAAGAKLSWEQVREMRKIRAEGVKVVVIAE